MRPVSWRPAHVSPDPSRHCPAWPQALCPASPPPHCCHQNAAFSARFHHAVEAQGLCLGPGSPSNRTPAPLRLSVPGTVLGARKQAEMVSPFEKKKSQFLKQGIMGHMPYDQESWELGRGGGDSEAQRSRAPTDSGIRKTWGPNPKQLPQCHTPRPPLKAPWRASLSGAPWPVRFLPLFSPPARSFATQRLCRAAHGEVLRVSIGCRVVTC